MEKNLLTGWRKNSLPHDGKFILPRTGHIACDSVSRSEIVLPLHHDGKVIAVLDIDSPILSRFSEDDQKGLVDFVCALERIILTD